MIRTLVGVGALALAVLLVAAACSSDEQNTNNVPPAVPTEFQQGAAPDIGTQVPPLGQVRTEKVTVEDGKLVPPQISLEAGVTASLEVTNNSSKDCTFFLGDLVQGFPVAKGHSVAKAFTVTAVSGQPFDTDRTVTMGCQGDPSRQGSAVIAFRGVRPGAGS
jgi:hypothetical protein